MAANAGIREFENSERRLFDKFRLHFQSHFFELEDPPLRARVIEVGSGKPVVLVHGGGGVAALWAPLMAELKDVRLLAVDRPGCGLTDGFNYRGVDFRRHAVQFLEGLLDALNLESAPFIANSVGGLWTFWLALDKPGRVSAIAQLGCPALILDTSAPFPMRLLSVRGLNQIMFAVEPPSQRQAKRILKRMGHSEESVERLPAEFIECFFRAGTLRNYKTGWLTLLERVLRLGGPANDLPLHEDELRRIRQPVAFVWGDSDPFGGPEVGRLAVNDMPNATLEVIPGGHLPWVDDAASCGQAALKFLKTHSLA